MAPQTKSVENVPRPIYTVGHSNHEWPAFLALLRQAAVTALIDVRTLPYSRRLPHFSRDAIERSLSNSEIAYIYLGNYLGGRPADEGLYDADGRVDYEAVRRTAAFQLGLERVLRGRERYTIALMCSEDDPRDCHRGLMITPALREHGVAPLHLRRDGRIETTDDLERDLLTAAGLDAFQDGLLALMVSEDERRAALADAYRRMAARKAYQSETEAQ
jgi:uncharacterized protein (DUF488 family)